MISNDGHSTSGSAVHKKALSDLKTNQTSPRDKNGKNYVLQNNSTGPTKVFVASLDCLTNGWISLNHRHSIESNGCRSKIHCHSIYTVDRFPTIHSLTMVGKDNAEEEENGEHLAINWIVVKLIGAQPNRQT